ncbi:MAG: hypothetical protein JWN34_3432 [Bryobacterales bacterium]|nr:hypothetical protein [Bryobacterales bacterium]
MTATNEISAIQLIANQLNAQKSTGPRTEDGKNNAKFNARRHGLTGQFYCMSENDEIAYKAFEASILPSLRPEGAYETQLAISITQDQWRLNRSKAVEFNLYGKGHDRHADDTDTDSPNIQTASTMADTYREDDRTFANIALYETRIHRMISKNEKRLAELRAEREAAAAKVREAEAAALAEAELLVRLAKFEARDLAGSDLVTGDGPSEGEILLQQETLAVNGFVFSLPQLLLNIRRKDRLETAKTCAKYGWDRARIEAYCTPRYPNAA